MVIVSLIILIISVVIVTYESTDTNMEEEDIPQYEEDWRIKWNPDIEATGGFHYHSRSHKLAVMPQGQNNEEEISEEKTVWFYSEGRVVKSTIKEIQGEGFNKKVYKEKYVYKNGVQQSHTVSMTNITDRAQPFQDHLDYLARRAALIVQADAGFSCRSCDYTSRRRDLMSNHVEARHLGENLHLKRTKL